jgi:hypothetical protein
VILENAIRKHDTENFTIESIYICEGGGGSIGRSVSNDHRKKISNANKKSDVEEINIQERKLNGILVG